MLKKQDRFIYDLMVAVRNYKPVTGEVTDEEIKLFINTFLSYRQSYNHAILSHGIKHLCENAVSYLFRGGEQRVTIDNAQFRRVMKTYPRFHGKPVDKDNDVYTFSWRNGSRGILDAFTPDNIHQWGGIIN